MKFCCKEMQTFISEDREPIKYDKVFREYYIDSFNEFNIITFSYCPWCGAVLPKSLRVEFFEALDQEYDIDTNIGEFFERSDLPSEFTTDEWWQKRSL